MFNLSQSIVAQPLNTEAYQNVAASFFPNPQGAPQEGVVSNALTVFGYSDPSLQDNVRAFKKDWNLVYAAGSLPGSYMGLFDPTDAVINDGVLNAIAWLWAEPRAMLNMQQQGQFKGKADLTRNTVSQGQTPPSWTPSYQPPKVGFTATVQGGGLTASVDPSVQPGGQATGQPVDTTPVLESKLSTIATNTPNFVQINFVGKNLSTGPDIVLISEDGSTEVPIATTDIQSDTVYAIGVSENVPAGIYDVFLVTQDDAGDEIATKQPIQLKAPEDFSPFQKTELNGDGANETPPISCPDGTFATLDDISGNWFCSETPPPQIQPTPPAQQPPQQQPPAQQPPQQQPPAQQPPAAARKKKSGGGMGPLLLLGGLGALLLLGSKKR